LTQSIADFQYVVVYQSLTKMCTCITSFSWDQSGCTLLGYAGPLDMEGEKTRKRMKKIHRKKNANHNCSEGTKLWWNWCEIHDHYISSCQRLHY